MTTKFDYMVKLKFDRTGDWTKLKADLDALIKKPQTVLIKPVLSKVEITAKDIKLAGLTKATLTKVVQAKVDSMGKFKVNVDVTGKIKYAMGDLRVFGTRLDNLTEKINKLNTAASTATTNLQSLDNVAHVVEKEPTQRKPRRTKTTTTNAPESVSASRVSTVTSLITGGGAEAPAQAPVQPKSTVGQFKYLSGMSKHEAGLVQNAVTAGDMSSPILEELKAYAQISGKLRRRQELAYQKLLTMTHIWGEKGNPKEGVLSPESVYSSQQARVAIAQQANAQWLTTRLSPGFTAARNQLQWGATPSVAFGASPSATYYSGGKPLIGINAGSTEAEARQKFYHELAHVGVAQGGYTVQPRGKQGAQQLLSLLGTNEMGADVLGVMLQRKLTGTNVPAPTTGTYYQRFFGDKLTARNGRQITTGAAMESDIKVLSGLMKGADLRTEAGIDAFLKALAKAKDSLYMFTAKVTNKEGLLQTATAQKGTGLFEAANVSPEQFADLTGRTVGAGAAGAIKEIKTGRAATIADRNPAVQSAAKSAKAVEKAAEDAVGAMDQVTPATDKAVGRLALSFHRLLSYSVAGGAIYGIMNMFRQAAQEVVALDAATQKLNQTLQLNQNDLSAVRNSLMQVASQLGATKEDVMAVAEEWAKQGLRGNALTSQVATTTAFVNVSGADPAEAVRETTAATKQLGLSQEQVNELLDVYVKLSQTQRVDAKDLSSGVAAVGALAQNAGFEVKTLAALLASTSAVSEDTGQNVAVAFRSILSRLNNPAAGTKKALAEIGITAEDYIGNLPALLQKIAAAWGTLDSGQRQRIAQAAAEKRRAAIFFDMMKAMSSETGYELANQDAQKASGALMEANNRRMEGLDKTIQALGASWAEFVTQFTRDSFLGTVIVGLLNMANGLLKAFNSLSQPVRFLLNTVLQLGVAFMALRSLGKIGGFEGLAGSFLGQRVGAVKQVADLGARITGTVPENTPKASKTPQTAEDLFAQAHTTLDRRIEVEQLKAESPEYQAKQARLRELQKANRSGKGGVGANISRVATVKDAISGKAPEKAAEEVVQEAVKSTSEGAVAQARDSKGRFAAKGAAIADTATQTAAEGVGEAMSAGVAGIGQKLKTNASAVFSKFMSVGGGIVGVVSIVTAIIAIIAAVGTAIMSGIEERAKARAAAAQEDLDKLTKYTTLSNKAKSGEALTPAESTDLNKTGRALAIKFPEYVKSIDAHSQAIELDTERLKAHADAQAVLPWESGLRWGSSVTNLQTGITRAGGWNNLDEQRMLAKDAADAAAAQSNVGNVLKAQIEAAKAMTPRLGGIATPQLGVFGGFRPTMSTAAGNGSGVINFMLKYPEGVAPPGGGMSQQQLYEQYLGKDLYKSISNGPGMAKTFGPGSRLRQLMDEMTPLRAEIEQKSARNEDITKDMEIYNGLMTQMENQWAEIAAQVINMAPDSPTEGLITNLQTALQGLKDTEGHFKDLAGVDFASVGSTQALKLNYKAAQAQEFSITQQVDDLFAQAAKRASTPTPSFTQGGALESFWQKASPTSAPGAIESLSNDVKTQINDVIEGVLKGGTVTEAGVAKITSVLNNAAPGLAAAYGDLTSILVGALQSLVASAKQSSDALYQMDIYGNKPFSMMAYQTLGSSLGPQLPQTARTQYLSAFKNQMTGAQNRLGNGSGVESATPFLENAMSAYKEIIAAEDAIHQSEQANQQARREALQRERDLWNAWFAALQEYLGFLQGTEQATTAQAYLLTKKLRTIAKTPQERLALDQQIFNLRKQVYQERLGGAEDWLSHQVALDRVSIPTQIKVWQQVLALAKKTKNRPEQWKAEEQIYNLQKQQAEALQKQLASQIFRRAAGVESPMAISVGEYRAAIDEGTAKSKEDLADAGNILSEFTKYMKDNFGGMTTSITGNISGLWDKMVAYANSVRSATAAQNPLNTAVNTYSAAAVNAKKQLLKLIPEMDKARQKYGDILQTAGQITGPNNPMTQGGTWPQGVWSGFKKVYNGEYWNSLGYWTGRGVAKALKAAGFVVTGEGAPAGSVGGAAPANISIGGGIMAAKSMVGKPYIPGGADASGADCSGLASYILKMAGFHYGRFTVATVPKVGFVPGKGSLITLGRHYGGGAHHMGIEIGGGWYEAKGRKYGVLGPGQARSSWPEYWHIPGYHNGTLAGTGEDFMSVLQKGELVVPKRETPVLLNLLYKISQLDLQKTQAGSVTMPVEINLTMPNGETVKFTENVVGIPGVKVKLERVLG
jgi:TP901 family phage tail tape measure protein